MRGLLAKRLSDPGTILIVARDAGLAVERLDLVGPPEQRWKAVLDEAERQGQETLRTLLEHCLERAHSLAEEREWETIAASLGIRGADGAGVLLSPERWKDHLTYTFNNNSHIELLGIRRQGGAVRIPLDRVYVQLRAERSDRGGEVVEGVCSSVGGKWAGLEIEGGYARMEKALGLHEALARSPRAAIIGDPGSGKTTLLRYVARVVGDGLLQGGKAEEKARALLALESPTPLPVPLYTTVARLDAFLEERETSASKVTATLMCGFLLEEVSRSGLQPGLEALQGALRAGQLLVLLDGLDEVPGHGARRRAAKIVSELLATCPKQRLLLTSRTRAYDPELSARLGALDPYRLQPMSEEEIGRFLEQWHLAVWEEEPARGRAEAGKLFAEIRTHPEVRRMADNPNVLTLMAILKLTRMKLPERRVELYKEVVDLFLELKDVAKELDDPWERELGFHLDLSEKRMMVARLALEMHDGGDAGRVVPAKLPVMCFARQLLDSGQCRKEAQALGLGEKVLDLLELRSGVLRREGLGVQFSHLAYQEFLAAWALVSSEDQEEIWAKILPHLEEDWWNEVIRLLAAVQEHRAGPLLCQLSTVGQEGERVDWRVRGRGVALAMSALRDLPGLYVKPSVRKTVMEALEFLTRRDSGARISDRIEALMALGEVGDPRLGMANPSRWVWIPPGEFTMGDDELLTKEELKRYSVDVNQRTRPAHRVRISRGFWMGKYPVTNGEYAGFVEAGGYSDSKWWSQEGWWWRNLEGAAFEDYLQRLIKESGYRAEWWEHVLPGSEPRYWQDAGLNASNHPIVGISWYEAEAYCRWLTERNRRERPEGLVEVLEESGWRWEDIEFRLPMEAEWEWCARGKSSRRYPWGENAPTPELANYREGAVGRTTPVGCYPEGGARWERGKLYDVTGNVWEWCRDIWNEGAYKSRQGVASDPIVTTGDLLSRALRGGSWNDDLGHLRCACRLRLWAGIRFYNVDFRCCLVSVSAEHGRS